jgi:predicted Rossmann-fold nucleotide-binding protein
MGCAVITGGGPGLMEAANQGAALAGTSASNIGIRVHLPFEQEVTRSLAKATSIVLSFRDCITLYWYRTCLL